MMPSMRAKHARNQLRRQYKGNFLPRPVIVEIALFYTRRAKDAIQLLRIDKKIKETLMSSPRFWYLICLQDYLNETFLFIKKSFAPLP